MFVMVCDFFGCMMVNVEVEDCCSYVDSEECGKDECFFWCVFVEVDNEKSQQWIEWNVWKRLVGQIQIGVIFEFQQVLRVGFYSFYSL